MKKIRLIGIVLNKNKPYLTIFAQKISRHFCLAYALKFATKILV